MSDYVRTVAKELGAFYNFKVDTAINPNLDGIYAAIRKYSSMEFADNDQLLIFIAGHGEFDPVFKEGYIVPSDAQKNDVSKKTSLSHSNARTIINNIPCKHIAYDGRMLWWYF